MNNRIQHIQEWLKIMQVIDFGSNHFQMTLSKKMRKSDTLKSIHVRVVEIKGERLAQVTYRHDTQDITKNHDLDALMLETSHILEQQLFNGVMQIDETEHSFISNKKNAQIKSKQKADSKAPQPMSNDKQKQRLIPESADFLRALGLASSNGKVYQASQKKYRQINKFIEIIASITEGQNIRTIADMGCGKGYLSFATYEYLSKARWDLQLRGYDLRPGLMQDCNDIAEDLKLPGLKFEVGNIADIDLPQTDMVIALHACDIATDMAIAQGIKSKAKVIVVSPCCHKQIRKSMKGNTTLNHMLRQGIMKERLAEWLTDSIRVLLLESQGYQTKIMEFISSEHTAKNLLITAVKGKARPEALQEIEQLKSQYGIAEHYLESLLSN